MPVYQFACEICGRQFERHLPFSQANAVLTCPAGHPHVRRVYSAPAILFKGSGFYSTDHPKTPHAKTGK